MREFRLFAIADVLALASNFAMQGFSINFGNLLGIALGNLLLLLVSRFITKR